MMFDVRSLIFDVKGKLRPRRAPFTSTIKHPPSHIPSPRFAMTLIELLVVIVILTTLVAGVIPILSPNNDTRKIRESTRMLQTYITMAQAEAARTGRAQGIGFQETSASSGVALEVFRLEVPVLFAGFSSTSAARIDQNMMATDDLRIRFLLSDTLDTSQTAPNEYDPDPVPPNFVRFGDVVSVGGIELRIIDTSNLTNGYYDSLMMSVFQCEVVQNSGQTLAFVKTYVDGLDTRGLTAPKLYKIIRQPVNSAEPPVQLPAGIAIDMQGSIAEGSNTSGFPTDSSLSTSSGQLDSVGIMFSPTGGVSSVFLNGNQLANVSRLVLLLGRVENGGLSSSSEWIMAGTSNEALSEIQEKINWLNLDSRWLSIAASTGRVVVTENAFVDPRTLATPASAVDQIEAAHTFAHEMKSVGAGK